MSNGLPCTTAVKVALLVALLASGWSTVSADASKSNKVTTDYGHRSNDISGSSGPGTASSRPPAPASASHMDGSLISAVRSRSRVLAEAEKSFIKKHDGRLPTDVLPQIIMLPMRDGVKLYTKFWVPFESERDVCSTVLIRSPYGPDGTENLAYLYIPFGFAIVMQNQRATGLSEGNWTFWKTASHDGFDTMDWISNQPWSNGRVYQMGASADGILSYLDMKIPQPKLHGQWLVFSNSLMYYSVFQGGSAYRENLVHHWLDKMQAYRPSAPSYERTVLEHEGYDKWWAEDMLTNLSNVDFPAVHLAGWYDIFLGPMLLSVDDYQTMSAPGARGKQKLIVGPRGHCFFIKGHSDIWFPDDLMDFVFAYEDSLDIFLYDKTRGALTRFDESSSVQLRNLLNKYSLAAKLNLVTLYVIGTSDLEERETAQAKFGRSLGMYWSTLSQFPESTPYDFFLGVGGKLLRAPEETRSTMFYNYDPRHPVPTVGGNNLFLSCGPVNQQGIENRSDVIVFTSDILKQPLAFCGQIVVDLKVSSNVTDTDFTVKISDVYPGDTQSTLIGDDDFRMRWRNGMDKSERAPPLTEGHIYSIQVAMWQTCYILNEGHALRLVVSSSNYPRFSANLNNGLNVLGGGAAEVARNSIHLGLGAASSKVSLPVVALENLPNNVEF